MLYVHCMRTEFSVKWLSFLLNMSVVTLQHWDIKFERVESTFYKSQQISEILMYEYEPSFKNSLNEFATILWLCAFLFCFNLDHDFFKKSMSNNYLPSSSTLWNQNFSNNKFRFKKIHFLHCLIMKMWKYLPKERKMRKMLVRCRLNILSTPNNEILIALHQLLIYLSFKVFFYQWRMSFIHFMNLSFFEDT